MISHMEYRTHLAPIDSTDLEMLRGWRNDPAIWWWCRQFDLISDAEQRLWYEALQKDKSQRLWKIIHAGSAVGVGGLTSIDPINQKAEFSLYISPHWQNQGLARDALSQILTHGYNFLNLNMIWGECFAGNKAFELFKDMGFAIEGIRRDFYFRDGRFINAMLLSMSRGEWREKKTWKK